MGPCLSLCLPVRDAVSRVLSVRVFWLQRTRTTLIWKAHARGRWPAGEATFHATIPEVFCAALTPARHFSTCHVVLSKEYYNKTVADGEPSDEGNDLLDLACVIEPNAAALNPETCILAPNTAAPARLTAPDSFSS